MLVKYEQRENALLPMLVHNSPITTDVNVFAVLRLELVIVTSVLADDDPSL
jgi:hypothetical protein